MSFLLLPARDATGWATVIEGHPPRTPSPRHSLDGDYSTRTRLKFDVRAEIKTGNEQRRDLLVLEAVGVVERVHVGPLEPVARHHEQVDRQIRPLEGLELRRLAADVGIRAELALDQILAEGQRHGDGGAEDKGGVDGADAEPCIGVLLRRVLEVHFWSLAAMLFLSSAAFDLCCQN